MLQLRSTRDSRAAFLYLLTCNECVSNIESSDSLGHDSPIRPFFSHEGAARPGLVASRPASFQTGCSNVCPGDRLLYTKVGSCLKPQLLQGMEHVERLQVLHSALIAICTKSRSVRCCFRPAKKVES